MSKQWKTLLLIATVVSSLSWLPGYEADAGSRTDMSSSAAAYEGECDFDDYQVKEQGKTCRARLRADSATEARISAKVVQVPKKRRLSDPAPAQGETATEEMLEVSIEASSSIAGCTTGCSRNSNVTRRFPISDARNVAAKALKEFEQEAERLRAEAASEAQARSRQEKCEVGSDNQPLEGRAKRECLVRRLAQIRDPEMAARYYDENLKDVIAEMIRSGNPQAAADAKRLIEAVAQIQRNNPYIRPALVEMAKFHDFHFNLSRAIEMYNSIPNDQNPANRMARERLNQQIGEYYRQGEEYFRGRLPLSERLTAQLGGAGWSHTGGLTDDISKFRQDLEGIYEDHANRVGGGNPQQTTNGQFQQRQQGAPGTGRGQFLNRNGQFTRQPTQPVINGRPGVVPGRPGTTPARPGQANPFGQPRAFGSRFQ